MIKLNQQKGSVLIAIIMLMPYFILITAAFLQQAVSNFRVSRHDTYRTHAQFAADAGIDAAMEKINTISSWTGTIDDDADGQIDLHNDGITKTTYEVSLTNVDDDNKTLTSIGRTFTPVNNSTASSTVKIEVNLRPVRSGEYSVVGGVGGLLMDNHAKILGGTVHINGTVSMKNHAQIGQTISPVTLTVAHNSCPIPPDATYPRLCGPADGAGDPIIIENDAHIYGTVRANNQTSGAAMSNPGLTAGPSVAVEPLPPHDRGILTGTINTAALNNLPSSQTGAAASCTTNTTKTWPANLKIIGNVEISKKCKLTVEGDVWITGNLIVDNNQTEMIVADALNDTRPDVMVDGTVTVNNSSKLKSNASGTGFFVITYKSDNACTTSDSGCDLSGTSLFNSIDDSTIDLDNAAQGPETIFYARWSKVTVKNAGQIGALIGQTVDLRNSGTITFGTSAGAGTEFWVIDSYKRSFD